MHNQYAMFAKFLNICKQVADNLAIAKCFLIYYCGIVFFVLRRYSGINIFVSESYDYNIL